MFHSVLFYKQIKFITWRTFLVPFNTTSASLMRALPSRAYHTMITNSVNATVTKYYKRIIYYKNKYLHNPAMMLISFQLTKKPYNIVFVNSMQDFLQLSKIPHLRNE